jgi:hypothetical protein
LSEQRLVWKKRREGLPALACSKRLESAAEGMEEIAKLGPEAFEIEIVSAARNCPACNKPDPPTREVREGNVEVKSEVKNEAEAAPDFKMAQLPPGDR